jgi:hypothetical protein
MTNARRVTAAVGAIGVVLVLSVPQLDPAGAPNGRPIARVNTDWWSRVQRGLAANEYRPHVNDAGLQAANRAHGLRTYFDGSGIRVHDRTAPASSALVGLSLVEMGRRDRLQPVTAGTVHQVDGRVEIRRAGVTEWYENSARGLEQGFTIESRTQGRAPLMLDLAVDHARASLRGHTIELLTDAGRRLDYGKLLAEDSRGTVLASRLEVPSPDRVRLVIEDADAVYPLLIDPLLTGQPDARLESNQSDPEGHGTPEFGFSVSSAGDVNGDGFDDVIVGAPGWDGGQQGEGAAFVFLGSAGGIVGTDPSNAQAQLESNQPLAAFGVSVSTAGDVNRDGYDDVIVGAHFYDSTLPGTQLSVMGAAFVFLGSPAGIQGRDPATAHASVFANKDDSEFGEVVAHAGDVNRDGFADIIVCAPHQGHDFPPDTNIPPNQQSGEHGAVFVFHGSAQGITSGTGITVADAVLLPYQLGPVDPIELAQFSSVAGAGDVNRDGFDDILVSGDDAFLFIGSAAGVVGRDPTTARSRVRRDALTQGLKAAAAGDVNGDGFADVLLSSPWRESVAFSSDQKGAAFVFLGGPGGIVGGQLADAHAAVFGSTLAEWVGHSIDSAGDVDRDGFADIVVAARVYPGSLANEGVAYLFRGSAQGITARSLLDADARLEAPQSGAAVKGTTAFSVAGAGDINNDGFADVIMGKGFFDAGQADEGAAFLYLGGPFPANPNQRPVAAAGADQSLFDVDDDGFHQVTLNGTGSFDPDGMIVSYAWFEGERLLGTSAVLTTSLSTTGDHTLALVVTDDDGVSTGDPVTVRVDKVSDPLVLSETFASGFGAWQSGGDVALASVDPFPTAPQVRFGVAGAFLRRAITLPAGSTGVTLDVWIKAIEFASQDEFRINVSVDGGPFTTIRTLTTADNSDAYVFYGGTAIPLGHSWFPATASSIMLEFESRTTTGRTFIDDVTVRALVPPPAAFGNSPSLSSLMVSPSNVTGGTSTIGTVTLTAAAPSGGVVVAMSDNSATVATPSTVTVPAGATSATFTATTTPVAITTVVTLTATVGSNSRTAGVTVTPAGGGGGTPAFRSPAGNAPDSGGDANGFESSATNAYGDDTSVAIDTNSGSGTSTSCTSTGKDRHRFYDYGIAIPSESVIAGIEVRVDARVDSTSGAPKVCVQLSWDGGTTWTAAKATGAIGTSLGTFTLGGATDTWGRTWSPANLSNASFRVRVINVASSTSRDFFLEWVAVRAHSTASVPVAVSALSLSPASVTSGMPSTGTVTLAAAAPPGGAVVSLASSNANAASVPASVTVPAGATSVTFTATTMPVTNTTLVTLTATSGTTRTADLTVTTNARPVAVAGPDQTLTDTDGDGLAVVTFDGTGSSDPDGTIVSHVWRKSGTLFNNAAAFSIVQPIGTHTIELTVTDNHGATSTDTVVITILHPAPPPGNLPPVSNAGPDQTVTDTDGDGIASVMLNGAASFDPDGAISGYGWYENGVQIASAFGVGVPLTVGVHTITLYVSDQHGASDTDTVVITVNAAVAPPAAATLTVTATGRSGERVTSSPAGISVSVGSTGSTSFAIGTSITLTVSNGRDAVFSGACSSGGNKRRTCTFTLAGTASVSVNVQ